MQSKKVIKPIKLCFVERDVERDDAGYVYRVELKVNFLTLFTNYARATRNIILPFVVSADLLSGLTRPDYFLFSFGLKKIASRALFL